jgi:hypothetical protein
MVAETPPRIVGEGAHVDVLDFPDSRNEHEIHVDDGELIGVRVTLSSLNPEYEPIVLEVEHADEIAAIAEYVESLGPPSQEHSGSSTS